MANVSDWGAFFCTVSGCGKKICSAIAFFPTLMTAFNALYHAQLPFLQRFAACNGL